MINKNENVTKKTTPDNLESKEKKRRKINFVSFYLLHTV